MIQFKTKYTNVTVDGIFTINKKGVEESRRSLY